VGDFMPERVVNRLVCGSLGIRVGERDDPRLIVATARALRGVVKLKTPARALVRRDPRRGARRNGLQIAVRALVAAQGRLRAARLEGQACIGHAIFAVIIADDMGVCGIQAADGAVEHVGADRKAHPVPRLKLGTQRLRATLDVLSRCPQRAGE
jgi:hypothetical protein